MWLDDYAIFMALKEENGGRCWNTLPEDLKYHRAEAVRQAQDGLSDAVRKHRILQYLFFRQWKALKQYAHEKGIRIFGDMPIYISYDSSDVWSAPWLFELDTHLNTVNVAGCPPDAFSPLGQRWGNPLYAWEKEKDDVFRWWIRRMEHAARLYDWIRIDHFRGFADYYAIPSYCETATVGEWRTGPGQALLILLARCTLGAVFAGNLNALLFSLFGGLLAMGVMILLSRCPALSIYGVSIAGAAAHNCGQTAAAMLTLGNTAPLYYLPLLLAVSLLTGAVTGFAAGLLFRALGNTNLMKA